VHHGQLVFDGYKEEPRRWLWELPSESISSWRGLCECFLDKFAPLGLEPEGP
jgi:hypothetical protein